MALLSEQSVVLGIKSESMHSQPAPYLLTNSECGFFASVFLTTFPLLCQAVLVGLCLIQHLGLPSPTAQAEQGAGSNGTELSQAFRLAVGSVQESCCLVPYAVGSGMEPVCSLV